MNCNIQTHNIWQYNRNELNSLLMVTNVRFIVLSSSVTGSSNIFFFILWQNESDEARKNLALKLVMAGSNKVKDKIMHSIRSYYARIENAEQMRDEEYQKQSRGKCSRSKRKGNGR